MNHVMLIGAVLPSFLLAHMIYRADRYQEPMGKFILAFIIGCFSPLVTLLFSGFFAGIFPVESNAWTVALLGAGVPQGVGSISAAAADLQVLEGCGCCLLYTSPSPRDKRQPRMPSSA